jgi:DNA repair protein RadC
MIHAGSLPSGPGKTQTAWLSAGEVIADIGGKLGIAVHDHIIIGREGHASLKALKLI